MSLSPPNLFEALFEFHPREGHTPKENFLTESFAYLLRTEAEVRDSWLSYLLNQSVEPRTCEVITRQTEKGDADTSLYPDLLLKGELPGGEAFAVYCEHKWDSPCNAEQLRRYRKVVKGKGPHARLVFVGATHQQKTAAKQCLQDPSDKCVLWEDAFKVMNGIADKPALLREFLDFMKTHGLSPVSPLTVEAMRAFLQASDFLKTLTSLTNRLNDEYSWDIIPERFHAARYVQDAYGRVGIRFETKAFKPGLTVGFLYDASDHKVTLIDPGKGIDLMLRIEAFPKHTTAIEPVLAVLAEKRADLQSSAASVLLKGESGNGNNYSVLIVRHCLADVIGSATSTDDQIEVIHSRLVGWLGVLFKDGRLEKAFKQCKLDSGLK